MSESASPSSSPSSSPSASAASSAAERKTDSPPPQRNQFDIHSAAMENVFIAISGLIGAGKSTLATALGEKLRLPVYYEPVIDNAYLADFYRETARYAFPMQGKGGVQDRTIYEDSVFARMLRDSGLMDDRDYQTYVSLFSHMSNFMKKPNIIVHLDVSPEESLRRIKLRNRGCESTISIDYLRNLHKAYEVFIRDISRIIPVIRVNYEKFRTAQEMADAIAVQYHAMTNIRHVTFEDADNANITASTSAAASSASGSVSLDSSPARASTSATSAPSTPSSSSSAAASPSTSPSPSSTSDAPLARASAAVTGEGHEHSPAKRRIDFS